MKYDDMDYKSLQAEAGKLGMKVVGAKKADLIAALKAAENDVPKDDAPTVSVDDKTPAAPVTPAPTYDKPDFSKQAEPEPQQITPTLTSDLKPTPAAPTPDQSASAMLAAAMQMMKDAQNENAGQQKKPSTPEEEIARRQKTDSSIIANMVRVPVTIPGGYVGAPKRISYCINGHRGSIKVGSKNVMVPRAVAEVIQRSQQLQQENMNRNKKMEDAAIKAGM